LNEKIIFSAIALLIAVILGIYFITNLETQTYKNIWSKSFGEDNNDEGYFVMSTDDKGCIALGYTIQNQTHNLDIYVVKIDKNGNKEWEKTYGGDGYDYGKSIIKTEEGYVIVGFSNSTKSVEYDYDIYLLKIDENGNKEWEKTYGDNGVEEGNSILQTDEGNYIITGSTGSYGNPEGDLWLLEVKNDGEIVLNQTYGGTGLDEGRCIIQANDGYLIAGKTKSYSENYAAWILKTSKTGEQIWNYTYESGNNNLFNNLIQTDDGFIMVGHALEKNENDEDKWNGYIVKTDKKGIEQWARILKEGKDTGISCVEETDDGYILLGYIGKYGEDDLLIEKIDKYGNRVWMETIGGNYSDGGVWIDRGIKDNYFVTGYTDLKGTGFTDLWIMRLLIN